MTSGRIVVVVVVVVYVVVVGVDTHQVKMNRLQEFVPPKRHFQDHHPPTMTPDGKETCRQS